MELRQKTTIPKTSKRECQNIQKGQADLAGTCGRPRQAQEPPPHQASQAQEIGQDQKPKQSAPSRQTQAIAAGKTLRQKFASGTGSRPTSDRPKRFSQAY